MEIITNDFTRHYTIFDKGKRVVSSHSEFELSDVNSYWEYIQSIDSLSVVYYNLTKRCNFNCTYCYSAHDTSTVSMENHRIILEKLKLLNTKSITLIGGEPFCHPQFHKILESCIQSNYFDEIYVVTNGSLINESMMHLYCNRLVTMQVSIDGIDELTNAKTRGEGHFELVFNNIKKLRENGAKVIVMKVITRNNIEDSKDFYTFYKNHHLSAGFFMVKQVADEEKPNIEQLKDLLNFIYENEGRDPVKALQIVNFADNMMFHRLGFPIMHCGAGINAISIMPNGDVYDCVKKEKNGNPVTNMLNNTAIDDIKRNRNRIITKDLVCKKNPCSNCDIAYYCGGGCRAEESIDQGICSYNCEYFHFAKDFFYSKLLEQYSDQW